ncbi:hypothetical protein M3P19_00805 [Muricauda sp. 2012CJ35-5]|uniref:Virulence factor Evf domain-containing protein n=1 Tax=Flagellimonas spongiicola TaxID=2942208 RepID=A0ABT0PMA6_9FLAO|nr:hypothetical protein [Allomuricauda spongiicola]MCL6272524.1 hypothetical protein [Allomuricauda spongiicola]
MEMKKDCNSIDRYTGTMNMFCFVFPECPEIKNKALQEELKIAKYYLEGYWTLVTRKLLENNTADDFDFTTNSIMNVVEKLPLLSGFSSKQESRRNVKDIYLLARDFLNITIDNLDPTEKCLKKTIGYLMNIGSQIGIANHNKHGYELNILSASIEHNAHSLQVKFKVSKAILDNLQKCGYESDMKKGRRVKFDYHVQSFEALLNLQSLQQPKVKAGLDRLFKTKDLSPIHNSRNYYNP